MPNKTEYENNIEKIREIMDQTHNYIRAAKSDEILQIIKMMYSEEEAVIGSKMNTIPERPEVIAERLNMKKEELIPILEQMADNGTVFRLGEGGNYLYSILPLDFGIYTTSFGKGEDNERSRALGKLWSNYIEGPFAKQLIPVETNIVRVIPIEKEIQGEQEVLPYESISKIIEERSYWSVAHCACRSARGFSGTRCSIDAPIEACLLFNEAGRHMVQRGFAREITKEECYEIVKRAEEFGVVHLTVNTKRECLVICSCCPCCCVGLKGVMLTQLHKPNAAAHTSYFSSINSKVCDGCKDLESPVCIDRCPMDAISLKDNKAVVKASTCIGCGVCKHFCPVEGAITLKKRKRALEPPEDLADLMTTLAEERTGA